MNGRVYKLLILWANYVNPYHDLTTVLLFNWRDLEFALSSEHISMHESRRINALAASGEGSRGVALYCVILSYVTAFQ